MFTSKPFQFQSGETAIKITPSVYLIDVPRRTNHNRDFAIDTIIIIIIIIIIVIIIIIIVIIFRL